jgi:hypothetical protein
MTNPIIANIVVGVLILIILLHQVHYFYLLTIKRRQMHWEVAFEEVLNSKN